jgi:hypothetical protein
VTADHPKNAHNAASSFVNLSRSRGRAKSLAMRKRLPMTHAVCVAAIECGADAIISIIKTNAARSVHFANADTLSIPTKASKFSPKDIA